MEKVGKDLKEAFQRQPGVREAQLWGVPRPEMRVSVDLGRLAELGIPVTQVTDACASAALTCRPARCDPASSGSTFGRAVPFATLQKSAPCRFAPRTAGLCALETLPMWPGTRPNGPMSRGSTASAPSG
jgi:hypothetical protein